MIPEMTGGQFGKVRWRCKDNHDPGVANDDGHDDYPEYNLENDNVNGPRNDRANEDSDDHDGFGKNHKCIALIRQSADSSTDAWIRRTDKGNSVVRY